MIGRDDAVFLIGDAQDAVTHIERGAGHRGDADPVGVEWRCAVFLEGEGERFGTSCGGREAVNHVTRLAGSDIGQTHCVEGAVNMHIYQVIGRCARILEVEVDGDGFAVIQGALGRAAVDVIFGRRACGAVTLDGTGIGATEGDLDVIHLRADAWLVILAGINRIDGHNTVGAAGDARAEIQWT